MSVAELLHCRHCGADKPTSQMRRDASYPSGYRPQCLDCKRRAERPEKLVKNVRPPKKRKLPAEERQYHCNRCGKDDVPYEQMSKDQRKHMGVGSWCLPCRRERNAEIKAETKKRIEEQQAEARALLDEGYEYCYKCNARSHIGVLRQPPSSVANGFPDGAKLCAKCVERSASRADFVLAERRRLGLPDDATRKQLESAARVEALRELAKIHENEYRRLYRNHMDTLGVAQERTWITI